MKINKNRGTGRTYRMLEKVVAGMQKAEKSLVFVRWGHQVSYMMEIVKHICSADLRTVAVKEGPYRMRIGRAILLFSVGPADDRTAGYSSDVPKYFDHALWTTRSKT